jgi:hypothetical protein
LSIFVQLGATRDGLDSYLHVARRRGMEAILIETPEYIRLRRELGRQEFDRTLAVDYPADAREVVNAIRGLPEKPALLLAGFERYIYSAYQAASIVRVLPYREGDSFFPPNKVEQRRAIARSADPILQPGQWRLIDEHSLARLQSMDTRYPLVLKPIDAGGGLGVFFISDFPLLEAAFAEIRSITNYDGGAFQGLLVEEYLPGAEYSVQGIVYEGECTVLTYCKKNVLIEAVPGKQSLYGFREVGYVATRGYAIDPSLSYFVAACASTFGYTRGPFHIDFVHSQQGLCFLEMGFRLSGFGLVRLVEQVSGHDWAEESFSSHLDRSYPQVEQKTKQSFVGQLTLASQEEIDIARSLQTRGYPVEIQLFQHAAVGAASSRLTSDLSRHTGSVGRVILSGQTQEEVEHLLQTCSPERTAGKITPRN